MATKRKRSSGSIEYVVRRRGLLPKPVYLTFDDEAEGDAYVARLEALLAQGIIPEALADRQQPNDIATLSDAINEYEKHVAVPDTDRRVLRVVYERVHRHPMREVNYQWVENWVAEMKQVRKLAPGTIRHHVGALARCLDWLVRKRPDVLAQNPLRLLPKRYAAYNTTDIEIAGVDREDETRDRRLEHGEEEAIRRILAGVKPENRQRPLDLPWQGALECLFDLALESAMRLREMFTLEVGQVDFRKTTIFLATTKNGDKRQVPITSVSEKALKTYLKQVEKGQRGMADFAADRLLFPWWDGDRETLNATTSKLSRQFGRIFDCAGCGDFNFHDLRHEATSRLYERTDLSDLEIASITGHKDLRMLKRYANLRGSTLAKRLW